MSENTQPSATKNVEEKSQVVIRFCGDSGDGMQLTGSRFTTTSAIAGNDIATLPDFPAEIRAPAGSLAGVSGYQINFSSHDIRTPGDQPDVLVAMNPAALKTNVGDLPDNKILIVNENAFTTDNLKLAGYGSNPLEDGSLAKFELYKLPLTTLTENALKDSTLGKKEKERSKNFFALGLMFWLYERPMDLTLQWIENKFKKRPEIASANKQALKSGYYFGETTEVFKKHYRVPKAKMPPGKYRHITGNEATALGFITAAECAGKNLMYASYPITPASDILHELSRHKNFGVKTLQAEDEIAAMGMAIGGAFAGHIALTGTSGPGLSLKSEALSLAIMMELPLVVINVQRGGPSTGLPTKTEQSDLLQALYGRHGESPIAIVAPATPGECFSMAIEAVRIAIEHMTPVIYLSDGYLANGAEPWKIPDVSQISKIRVEHPVLGEKKFLAYARNDKTLARPWALPGTPGLEHRLGGLEKNADTGNVSYDPANHEHMVHLRAEKIYRIHQSLPKTEIFGEEKGEVLLIGWGSTHGSITSAVEQMQKSGIAISSVHVRYLNPLPQDLKEIMGRFKHVITAELNLGQLAAILRTKYLVDVKSITKVQGKPFTIQDIIMGVQQIVRQKGVKETWQPQPKLALQS